MTKRYVLYRIYDTDDELLYIGATINPGGRFNDHARAQPWWDEAATIRLEHFDSLEALLAAEDAAIRLDGPQYNVLPAIIRPWASKPRRPRGGGSVFRRADGYWVGVVELPRDQDGKRRRKRFVSRDRETVLQKIEDLKQGTL